MSTKILQGPALKYKETSTLGQFYFNCAEQFADRICQTDADSDQSETYSNVKERSVRVALEMQKRGITPTDVVVFCTKVTLDNIIPMMASFYLGAKVANLDPILSLRQTTHLLSLVTPKMIFVQESSVSLIEESLQAAKLTAEIVVFGKSDKYSTFVDFVHPKTEEKDFVPTKVDIEDTGIIFFSSGTTGLPKAICHSHATFLSFVHSFHKSGCRCDVVLYFTSFYWMSGLLLLTSSFITGGRRIFCSTMTAEATFRIIDHYKVTYLFLAPILTYQLTSFERHQEYDTSSLNSMLVGGTPISVEQYQRLSALFKHSTIIFGYGLSEVGVVTIFNPETDGHLLKTKVGSSGKAAPGVAIKVVDLTSNEPLGPNQKGEILVKSPGVMKGYYNTDSSAVFDHEGFLKTGDIGYYDEDGCFYIIERLKEMFKYMSWHIVPSSLESVLLEHPSVKEAVVFGIPQSEEVGEIPAACVVLKEKCKASKEEIEEFVAVRVADYEKLRGGVIFVDSLMRTPSGKLMRKEIRQSILSSLYKSNL